MAAAAILKAYSGTRGELTHFAHRAFQNGYGKRRASPVKVLRTFFLSKYPIPSKRGGEAHQLLANVMDPVGRDYRECAVIDGNHRRAVAQHSINGDCLSQWKMPKFDPL